MRIRQITKPMPADVFDDIGLAFCEKVGTCSVETVCDKEGGTMLLGVCLPSIGWLR